MKIYHFYHIFADGKWIIPLWEHLNALRKGQLKDHLEAFYIGITGTYKNKERVLRFLQTYHWIYPFNYSIVNHTLTGWEQATLDKLYEFSLEYEGYVLYAHTKGAFNSKKPNPCWRRSMTFFNVIKWKEAMHQLKEHKAVGCHWLLPEDLPINGYYFAGNFWWAHLSLIRTLEKPLQGTRYDAEAWIGNKYKTHPFPIYDLNPGFPDKKIFRTGSKSFK